MQEKKKYESPCLEILEQETTNDVILASPTNQGNFNTDKPFEDWN